MTLVVVVLAWVGPLVAAHDPMATLSVAHVGERWIRPPFPALTVPGYPLGSDTFGRDLLSRLLWGIRPTLLLVVAVAGLRLSLGVVIGVSSAWSSGLPGRLLRGFTGGALAVPVLLVGLAVNAALSTRLGIWAFVVGLALTGWAETARLVHEQIIIIRGQPYIEAARALGTSGSQIVARHVLNHIAPLVWMLWAYEISGTLLVTAELGFLGYFIGGGTWVQISDWTAVNTTSFPELGQMLASSYNIMLLQPEGMVAAGTVIFLAILGFNLLGEGLRRRLALDQLRYESLPAKAAARVGEWLDQCRKVSARFWSGRRRLILAGVVVGGVAIVAAVIWWRSEVAPRGSSPTSIIVPGAHLWAAERHDGQGSLWTEASGPTDSAIAWAFQSDDSALSGGPAVAADGTVYIGSKSGKLYALRPDGTLRWVVDTGAPLVGSPALGPYGDVYVTDHAGRLSVYQPDQLLLWRFQPASAGAATSGPVVASNGTVYYTLGNILQAVSLDGHPMWQGQIRQYLYITPRLSGDGGLVFLSDIAFRTRDGSSFALQFAVRDKTETVNAMHVVGGDGRAYYYYGHVLIPWERTDQGVTAGSPLTWNYTGEELQLPVDAGATGDGVAWLFYANGYSAPRIVWVRAADGQLLGNKRYLQPESRLMAVAPGAVAYTCGLNRQETTCAAYKPGTDAPVWQASLGANGMVSGGALVPGRLYVTTESGMLIAVGQGMPGTEGSGGAGRTPVPTWTLPYPAQTAIP